MNERHQIALKLILVHIILPAGLIFAFIFVSGDAYLFFFITQTYLCILLLSGYWEFFSNPFKVLFFLILESVMLLILLCKIGSSLNPHLNIVMVCILALIQTYLTVTLARIIVTIFKREKNAFEIVFPLRNGRYLITDGGNSKISRLMNYHYHSRVHRKNKTNNSMLFATDIVKIGKADKRFLPKYNEEYPIFGENVYSPIEGIVIKAEKSIDDNPPFIGTYPYNTGNTVIIKRANHYYLLGHLKKGSITVSTGEMVKQGDLIGQIGNSGYSERPHLHMQLVESDSEDFWHGKGLCILFNGRNLFKNRVIEIA